MKMHSLSLSPSPPVANLVTVELRQRCDGVQSIHTAGYFFFHASPSTLSSSDTRRGEKTSRPSHSFKWSAPLRLHYIFPLFFFFFFFCSCSSSIDRQSGRQVGRPTHKFVAAPAGGWPGNLLRPFVHLSVFQRNEREKEKEKKEKILPPGDCWVRGTIRGVPSFVPSRRRPALGNNNNFL